MSIKRVLVCETQVPLVRGGAENLVRQLVAQLRRHGYLADRVSLPFKWYPKEEILAHAAAWRLLDLSESSGYPIDLVIGTKFPSYFARHPHKVVWLIHQYRAAYDLCGTRYGEFDHTDLDVGVRERLIALDTQMLGECRRLYTISRNTAARLEKFNGLHAGVLYHPPKLADRLHGGPYGDYVLSVARLESVKRISLVVRAFAKVPSPVRFLIVGDGTERRQLEALVEDLRLGDRVTFLGAVSDEALIALYADALAVVYAPYDEDYGYATLEAFLARKPVITALDSGGTLEFVRHGVNGLICEPDPEALADAIGALHGSTARAAALGEAGFDLARAITWDGVIEALVGA
jgi:glycosyltransferase involved in cell wall biosynthesis